MLFSYTYGTSVKSEDIFSSQKDVYNKKYKNNYEYGPKIKDIITLNFEKYNKIATPEKVRILSNLATNYNINPSYLVAADIFLQNNNKDILTNDMFLTSNYQISQIISTLKEKKEWNIDNYVTLLTYIIFLREKLYKNVKEVIKDSSDDSIYDFIDDDNDNDYD